MKKGCRLLQYGRVGILPESRLERPGCCRVDQTEIPIFVNSDRISPRPQNFHQCVVNVFDKLRTELTEVNLTLLQASLEPGNIWRPTTPIQDRAGPQPC